MYRLANHRCILWFYSLHSSEHFEELSSAWHLHFCCFQQQMFWFVWLLYHRSQSPSTVFHEYLQGCQGESQEIHQFHRPGYWIIQEYGLDFQDQKVPILTHCICIIRSLLFPLVEPCLLLSNIGHRSFLRLFCWDRIILVEKPRFRYLRNQLK